MPLEHIQNEKAQFVTKKFRTFTTMFRGLDYSCFLLPACYSEQKNFVINLSPDFRELKPHVDLREFTVFGLSEEIPESFRPLWILPELYVSLVHGMRAQYRRKLSHSEELSQLRQSNLAEEVQSDYRSKRKRYLLDLIKRIDKKPERFLEDEKSELQIVLDHFFS